MNRAFWIVSTFDFHYETYQVNTRFGKIDLRINAILSIIEISVINIVLNFIWHTYSSFKDYLFKENSNTQYARLSSESWYLTLICKTYSFILKSQFSLHIFCFSILSMMVYGIYVVLFHISSVIKMFILHTCRRTIHPRYNIKLCMDNRYTAFFQSSMIIV